MLELPTFDSRLAPVGLEAGFAVVEMDDRPCKFWVEAEVGAEEASAAVPELPIFDDALGPVGLEPEFAAVVLEDGLGRF